MDEKLKRWTFDRILRRVALTFWWIVIAGAIWMLYDSGTQSQP
jgi:hypothetical protein